MKNLNLIIFFCLLFFFKTFSACKKSNTTTSPAATNCLISSISDVGNNPFVPTAVNTNYSISYDSLGRVTYLWFFDYWIPTDTDCVKISYSSQFIKRTYELGHSIIDIDSIILNVDGSVNAFYSRMSGLGYQYYHSQNPLDSVVSIRWANIVVANYFEWGNGDLIKTTHKSNMPRTQIDSSSYQYDTTKEYMMGDYLQVMSLLQFDGEHSRVYSTGSNFIYPFYNDMCYIPYNIKNEHLVKEMNMPLSNMNQPYAGVYIYTYDETGKIIQINANNNGLFENINIQYTCQ